MTTVTSHPTWTELAPLLRVQTYDRDGGHDRPRHRLEVDDPRDLALRGRLLAMEVECVAGCGRWIRPVRERQGAGRATLYLAVACELGHRFDCCRGRAAAAEYVRLVEAIRGIEAPHPRLF